MKFWWSERLPNEAAKLYWKLQSIFIHFEFDCLSRVAHLHLIMPCLVVDMQKHIL